MEKNIVDLLWRKTLRLHNNPPKTKKELRSAVEDLTIVALNLLAEIREE